MPCVSVPPSCCLGAEPERTALILESNEGPDGGAGALVILVHPTSDLKCEAQTSARLEGSFSAPQFMHCSVTCGCPCEDVPRLGSVGLLQSLLPWLSRLSISSADVNLTVEKLPND